MPRYPKYGTGSSNPFWWIAWDRWSCPECPTTYVSPQKDRGSANLDIRRARDTHRCES